MRDGVCEKAERKTWDFCGWLFCGWNCSDFERENDSFTTPSYHDIFLLLSLKIIIKGAVSV